MKLLKVILVLGVIVVVSLFGFKYFLRFAGINQYYVATEVQKRNPLEFADLILHDVPFTVQAPFAEWKDPRQQEGCEEASALMAVHWARGKKIESRESARAEILAISKFQEEKFGNYHDTSAKDTAGWILEGYYKFKNYKIKPVASAEAIVEELAAGNIVIVPANGRALKNIYFTQPGPQRHMLVVTGYDKKAVQFITNETGIKNGEGWRYDKNLFFEAIRDYDTGYHVPITTKPKVMIIIAQGPSILSR